MKKVYFSMDRALKKSRQGFLSAGTQTRNSSIHTSAGAVCFDLKLKQSMKIPANMLLETTHWNK
jgi:hypothetical protein